MNIRQFRHPLARAILGLTLLFGIGVGLALTGNAQDRNDDQDRRDRNWDRYGNYGGSAALRQTALNAGYNEGIREGRYDRDNGRSTDYRNQNTYQRATKDYSPGLGSRELYRRYFREAYENGYNAESNSQIRSDRDDHYRDRDRRDNGNRGRRGRNWDGYGNFGGSSQLRQTALNAGYNEGMKQGQNNRNKRNNDSYEDQSAYRKATKDYSARLGDREVYRRYFRAAYENGYNDGLNGY